MQSEGAQGLELRTAALTHGAKDPSTGLFKFLKLMPRYFVTI